MKAQILKLAGVKSDADFYKKFPTEKSFMAKHGVALKKAQVGAMIGESDTPMKQFTPTSYNDLYANANASVTGISPAEQARQEGLASQQAIASASSKKGGIGDILGNIDPKLIMSLIGGAKNGKKLTKAQQGASQTYMPLGVPDDALNPQMPSDYQAANSSNANLSAFGGIKSFTGGDLDLSTKKGFDYMGLAGKLSPVAGTLIGAYNDIEQNKKDIAKAKMYGKVSDVTLQASLRPEQSKKRYVRPEDQMMQNFKPLGVGTNYLAAKNGKKVKKAEGGVNLDPFAGIAGGIGGALGSATKKGTGKGGPGSIIGSILGGIAGSFIPIPRVGKALGTLAGGFIGGLFDGDQQNDEQLAQDHINQNLQNSALQSGAQNLQMQNKGFMENGGNVHRAGGHLQEYTPPSYSSMNTAENGTQLAMGGDLQVGRGYAETMSHNPYLPGDGETVMFRGPSHDNGGMPVSFGQNGVEVEGGEPAIKMQDGGEQENLIVYGDMKIPEYGVNEINDPKAKGKKFKHYVADLSKQEAKINKSIDKGVTLVNDNDTGNPFDQLAFNSGKAMMMGGDLKLKTIAQRKMDAASVQNAILDTAKEHGLESSALAKGKIKYAMPNDPYAKFGGKFSSEDIFQKGGKKSKTSKIQTKPQLSPLQSFIKDISLKERTAMANNIGVKDYKGTADQNQFLLKNALQSYNAPLQTTSPSAPQASVATPSIVSPNSTVNPSSTANDETGDDWKTMTAMGVASALGQMRPTNTEFLDPSQLAPEMMALSMNSPTPVQAQTFQPLLSQPMSVSYQDQLNEITSSTRAAEKMSAYNPEAASMIAAQSYGAKNKVLGEQFRMNQAEQQRVSEQNRNVLNDASLKNLAIYDTQYQRQEQTNSNTKQQALEVMKSIADKTAKNKLENRNLGVMENMYNYRFNKSGQAYNLNGPQFFQPNASASTKQHDLASGYEDYYNEAGKRIGTKKSSADSAARNGALVKAIKNL